MVPRAGPGDPMTTRWAFGLIGMGIVVGLGYVRLARPWHLTWGAAAAEVRGSMSGDELIPEPSMCATRAITIQAPPEAVWPWLVQMGGYNRAGWYSYDRFDNAGVPSANRGIPDLQDLQVGTSCSARRARASWFGTSTRNAAWSWIWNIVVRVSPAFSCCHRFPTKEPGW